MRGPRALTLEDIRIAGLFKRWLEETYSGKAFRFKECRCGGAECVGHIKETDTRFWPALKKNSGDRTPGGDCSMG